MRAIASQPPKSKPKPFQTLVEGHGSRVSPENIRSASLSLSLSLSLASRLEPLGLTISGTRLTI